MGQRWDHRSPYHLSTLDQLITAAEEFKSIIREVIVESELLDIQTTGKGPRGGGGGGGRGDQVMARLELAIFYSN